MHFFNLNLEQFNMFKTQLPQLQGKKVWLRERYISKFSSVVLTHTVHGVLKARILKWFAIPFSRGPHSVRPLHHDRLGWPHTAWLSFIELDKAVVLWSDWLVLCDYGFSVAALWCPPTTPTVLLGFLLPWMRGISSWPPLYFTDDETQVKGDITCPEHTARKGQCYGPGLIPGCRTLQLALSCLRP